MNYPIKDINDRTCAIIKVESGAEQGFSFDTGTVAITETIQKSGQIWVYVSPGVIKLNIFHNDYKACYYELPIAIESGRVYSLNLRLTKRQNTFEEIKTFVTAICKNEKAEIWLDGEYKGIGKWSGIVTGTAAHAFETRMENHRIQSKLFWLKSEDDVTIILDSPSPIFAYLNVTSKQKNARVKFDDTDFGTTPINQKVIIGRHHLEISADNYETEQYDIQLEEDELYSLDADLNRADVSLKAKLQQEVSLNSGWMGYTISDINTNLTPSYFKYLIGVRLNKFYIGGGANINLNNISISAVTDNNVSTNRFSADLTANLKYYFLRDNFKFNPYISTCLICDIWESQSNNQNTNSQVILREIDFGRVSWSVELGASVKSARINSITFNLGVRYFEFDYKLDTNKPESFSADLWLCVPMASVGFSF